MKQRFKARELWLFAPFLLFGVAALLYWRWEQVTPTDKRGMYVSKIERTPATAREVSLDMSHYVTVTLSHSWPKPRWWGEKSLKQWILDPLAPEKPPIPYDASTFDTMIAGGATLTAREGGKIKRFDGNFRPMPGYISIDGSNYVVKHPVSLHKVPPNLGAVEFRGIYQMTGTQVRQISRVVRAAGEKFPPTDKDPGARVVSIAATPWKKEHVIGMNNVPEIYDSISIVLILKHTKSVAQTAKKNKVSASINGVDDEANSNIGYTLGLSRPQDEPKISLKPNQSSTVFYLSLDERDKTRGRVIIKGKASADDRWPLSFELKLPSRPAATAPGE